MFAATKAAFCGAGSPFYSPLVNFAAGEQGVWLDPNNLATVWQDSARTIPGAVGSVVGCIDDLSGHGHNAVQATTAKKPILRLNGTTGYRYLEFDGVDDCLVTPSIDFSASDEMSIFAAVRKLVNAARILCELSANYNTNAGSFFVLPDNGTTRYESSSRGNASPVTGHAAQSVNAAQPDSAVLSCTHDISDDLTTIRRNGAAGLTSGTANKGAGNFGNWPIYIGQRGAASLPLNGHLYGLLVRGKVSSGAEITDMETYLNARIGAY